MAHIHYKFSSKLSSDTAVFNDSRITLMDLKRQIMGREKLRAGDCDLQIINAQTKEEYTDDEGLISKGSSVIVRRIPLIGVKSSWNSKTRNVERSHEQLHHAFGAIKAMANLAEVDVSEEEKINMVVAQASINQPKNFDAALPANYTCYRCGDAGHHIRNCPTGGARTEHQERSLEVPLRLKKSTGIPRSFMVEVDGPNVKGAMLTNCGHYAIPAMHAKAYAIGKKENPPFFPKEQPKPVEKEEPVPEELLCLICRDLLSDAVVIPCCGGSYCDDCIRTALLDSEEHVCPTCKKSNVSPDTLVANKFLRQAVNTFENEQGQAKSLQGQCDTSQSQSPPLMSFTTQSHPRKFHQSAHRLQATDALPPPQVCVAAHTATGSAPASIDPSTSLQSVHEPPEIPPKRAVKGARDDSAPAALSVLVPNKEPAAAVSQLVPLVRTKIQVETAVVVQSQTDAASPQRSAAGQVLGQPSNCWESSFSSGCSTEDWSKSNTQLCPPIPSVSSYPAAPPPLFLPPHFHTFLSAQQPLNHLPPGYQPVAPVWTLQTPPGAHIPSLCSSTPTLHTKERCMHQRKRNERSPHRRQTYKRSSSSLNSKSSKFRSSRSYSRSSSRSRSRSCSKGRSRPHSPDSRHRDRHSHSHSSHSYTHGYKRSPTPSLSSSPRVGHHSRSKASPDRRKSSHHSRHYSKKSTSSRHSSRRRGESSQGEAGKSRTSSPSHPYTLRANKASLKMDRQQYLEWKQEYKDWCEKYYDSYVSHFNQLPPPCPFPQWTEREGSRKHSHTNLESGGHLQGKGTEWVERSSPSQSSSDSRSPPPDPSKERRSTPSQSSRERRHSSSSHLSVDSHSPPAQSSRDISHAASEDKDHLRTHQQRCAEKQCHLQVRLPTPKESSKDGKQHIATDLKNLRSSKYDQKKVKKYEEDMEKESSSTSAADSAGGLKKDKRTNSTRAKLCKDADTEDAAAAAELLELTQLIVKPDKQSGRDSEIYVGEERHLEIEKRKYSDSRQYEERRHKDKSSKRARRIELGRYRNTAGSKDFNSELENRKRKAEDVERSSVEAESYKFLKTDFTEVPEIHKSDSLSLFQKKKTKKEEKKESKRRPLSAKDIWDGEIKVKPQKKISIHINIDGKVKDEKTERTCLPVESTTGNTMEEKKMSEGEEEKERGALVWKKATFRDVGETEESKERKDLASYCHVLRTADEQKESKEQEECDGMRNAEERSSTKGVKEEGRRVRNDSGGNKEEKVDSDEDKGVSPSESKAQIGLMGGLKWSNNDEEDTRSERNHDGPNITEVDESCHENHQRTTLEELSQDRAAGTKEALVLVKMPYSKWKEEESEEEEQDGGELRALTDAPAARLPPSSSSSMSVTAEKETENNQGIREREGNRASSHRGVAPSSGKDRTGEKEGLMKTDELTEKEKGKESEKLTEGWREDEKEGRYSSKAALQKRNSPSFSHPCLNLMSCDMERSDRQLGDDQGSNKSSCSPGGKPLCCSGLESSAVRKWPEQKAQQADRNLFLDLERKDEDHSHSYPNQDRSSGDIPHRHSPTWIHHLSPSFSQSKVIEGDFQDGQTKWEVWSELEERERCSSRSIDSSKSSESSGKAGVTKPKKEKRPDISDLLEEGEQRKDEMSEQNTNRGEDRSCREMDEIDRGEG